MHITWPLALSCFKENFEDLITLSIKGKFNVAFRNPVVEYHILPLVQSIIK